MESKLDGQSEMQRCGDAQNLAEDSTRKNGVDGKHEPSPSNGDLQSDLEKDVLVEVVVVVGCEVLRVCGPTQDCRKMTWFVCQADH